MSAGRRAERAGWGLATLRVETKQLKEYSFFVFSELKVVVFAMFAEPKQGSTRFL